MIPSLPLKPEATKHPLLDPEKLTIPGSLTHVVLTLSVLLELDYDCDCLIIALEVASLRRRPDMNAFICHLETALMRTDGISGCPSNLKQCVQNLQQ